MAKIKWTTDHNVKTKVESTIAENTLKYDSERTNEEKEMELVSGIHNKPISNGKHGEHYELYTDENNRTVFWLVKNPSVDFRYDVVWSWDKK